MKCIINKALKIGTYKGKSIAVISRFLRIHYKLSISESLLKKRLSHLTNLNQIVIE